MGQLEQAVREAILGHAGGMQIKQILTGTAIDVTDLICTVEREDAPTLYNVRLNAIDDNLKSFVTIIPAEKSNVIVGIIENLKTEAIILRCSEVQKVILKISNQTLSINKDGFVFNEGKNKGMLKLDEVIEWMGKVYADLQTLKTQLSIHAVAGNGSPLGLIFNVNTPNPKADTFENKNVKH